MCRQLGLGLLAVVAGMVPGCPVPGAAPADAAPATLDAGTCQSSDETEDARVQWARWPMAETGTYDTSVPGVVLDNVTGLMWERSISSYGVWADGNNHCRCLGLGGYRDWRMPSLVELITIVDYGRQHPAIDPVAFPGTPPGSFWSSSGHCAESNTADRDVFYRAFGVDFAFGSANGWGLAGSGHANTRCVREAW
ncbi:MAG: DUF1566 domain-containing protein [Deltaproteobacteria bacterium]|nr:DUF1566 domain-containing protein [Deltaproteobacteria bacterium]